MRSLYYLMLALLVTILVEGCIVALWKRNCRFLMCSVLCNIATNPLLNVLLLILREQFGIGGAYHAMVAAGEILVVLFEAFLYSVYMGRSYRSCLLVSLVLNLSSYGFGIVFGDLIW